MVQRFVFVTYTHRCNRGSLERARNFQLCSKYFSPYLECFLSFPALGRPCRDNLASYRTSNHRFCGVCTNLKNHNYDERLLQFAEMTWYRLVCEVCCCV